MPEELLNAGPISRTTCRDQRRSLSDGIAYAKAVRAREPIMTGASSVSRGYGRRRGSTSLQSETPAGAMAWAKPPSASAGASRLSANGRCRYHGGRTPSGKQWHKEQLPTRPGPRDVEKLDKKLSELQRRRKRRAARVEEMTPPERERYEAWQRSHKPGGPAARERNRQDRAARKLISKLLGDNEAGRAAAQTGSMFD